jgi:predicted Ser/Thr protein kinase
LDELQAGDPRQIGTYTLFARLGSGGMGQVYFGRSLGGRHVAVKVIRADLAQDQSFRARFGREVEAARRVSGAFTAPVIDADPDAPMPWLVTDYVHGPSLGDAVAKHGPLPLRAVLTLAARLAEGLCAVHAAGVIHRDLKPANVLLAEDGPRLIDFGISQAADFAQITSPTTVLGTPGFIAPELVQGDSVGPSSDIFTMGAVLAYAATGELPFGAGPADARTLRVLYLAPDLDNVPAELRPLLERCMAKDPTERPTAGEFLADLVAACPDAADDREDWLPADILAEIRQRPLPEETATSRLRVTVPPHVIPPVPAGRSLRKPWTTRRRVRVTGVAAAVAVLASVVGLLVAPSGHPAATAPTLPPPAGLFAVQTTATAVTLGWNSYSNKLLPDQIEILENGKKIAAIPGYYTNYKVAGLRKDTAYHFSTVAVIGAHHSSPSPSYNVINGHITPQGPLSLADAAFNWVGTVSYKETYSSDDYWIEHVGDKWQDPWDVSTGCDLQACDATLDGSISGISFTATLHRFGAMYTGSAAMNKFFSCSNGSNYQKSTLNIHLTVTKATNVGGQWFITSFKGTLTWNVPYDPNPGCDASLYQMTVSSMSS